jgi:hypothetical protein
MPRQLFTYSVAHHSHSQDVILPSSSPSPDNLFGRDSLYSGDTSSNQPLRNPPAILRDMPFDDAPWQPAPNAPSIEHIASLWHACATIQEWTSTLGDVEDWPRIFREQFDEACIDTAAATTQDAIDKFLRAVEEHVRNGRAVLNFLASSPAIAPPQSPEAKADWLFAHDMMATVHRGVAMLEARLEDHAPRGPLPSDLHSNIRRWKGFHDSL